MNKSASLLVVCVSLTTVISLFSGCIHEKITEFVPGNYANKPTKAVLSNPYVKGVLLSIRWRNIEVAPGVYKWENLDKKIEKISKRGKCVVLNVMTCGINPPDWLMNDSEVEKFYFVDRNPHHSTYGKNLTAIVYWDEKYMEEKERFIRDLGKRYANNTAVVGVMVSFVGTIGNDWFIPHDNETYQELIEKGYSTDLMFEVGKRTIDAWANAFPRQVLKLPIGISLADGNNTITTLAEMIVEYAYSKYPDRFYAQINALSTGIPYSNSSDVQNASKESAFYLLKILSRHPKHIGFQLLCDATSSSERLDKGNVCEEHDPRCVLEKSLERAFSYEPYYIEYWYQDVENLILWNILKDAEREMGY